MKQILFIFIILCKINSAAKTAEFFTSFGFGITYNIVTKKSNSKEAAFRGWLGLWELGYKKEILDSWSYSIVGDVLFFEGNNMINTQHLIQQNVLECYSLHGKIQYGIMSLGVGVGSGLFKLTTVNQNGNPSYYNLNPTIFYFSTSLIFFESKRWASIGEFRMLNWEQSDFKSTDYLFFLKTSFNF